MSSSNRQVLIHEVHRVLKEHFTPIRPPADRTVLEHLLYACCLENAPFEAADEAFAKLQQSYFDWNEVRVTTITELAETLSCLPGPAAAATRLKRSLQSVFETHYAFDLEYLKKHKLGNAVKELEAIDGTTPFVVSYVTQQALGGHAIPCCQGIYALFQKLGIMTQAEAAKHRVPGLERAIPKTKGIEFASLLHQLGTEYSTRPNRPRMQTIVACLSAGLQKLVSKRSKAATSPEDAGDKKGNREARELKAARKKPLPKRPVAEPSPTESPPLQDVPVDTGPAAEPGVANESITAPEPETPASEEPRLAEPASKELRLDEPASEEPRLDEPASEEPRLAEPASEEPRLAEPASEEPRLDEPASEEPRLAEPASEEPDLPETLPLESPETLPLAETPLVEQPEDAPATGEAAGAPPRKSAAHKRATSPAHQEERSENGETDGDVPQPTSLDPKENDPGDPPERKKSTTKQLSRKKPR